MKFTDTGIAGLRVVHFDQRADERGSFERTFCACEMSPLMDGIKVEQANLSYTSGKGSLRGLHFQSPPRLEAKLVRCLRGSVFDVAVDLREGSPSFLRWHGVELKEDGHDAFFIPEGFAHGFQVTSDDAQLLYLHTAFWDPACEGGLRYDDPALAIDWPLRIATISPRDHAHPFIDPSFKGLRA